MVVFIVVLTYALIGALFIGLAVPLVQGRVKPNPWYGFRVPKTLSDTQTWYAVNAYFGRRFAVAGLLMAVVGLLLAPLGWIPHVGLAVYVAAVDGVIIVSPFLIPALCCAAAIAARQPASADAPKPDSGKFTLLLQNKTIGTDTFRLLGDGCDSDVVAGAGAGPNVQFHQTLTYKKGRWTQLSTDAGALGKISVTLGADKSSIKVDDKPATTQKLPATVYPYGDRSPHLLAFLVAAYDAKKGGDQKFDLIYTESAGPRGIVALSAIVKAPQMSSRQNGGKPLAVSRYPLTLTAGAGAVAMEVQTDKDGHLLYWSVPAQKYTAVREGFEDLAK